MVGSHLDHVVAQIDLKNPDTDISRAPMLGAALCFIICLISLLAAINFLFGLFPYFILKIGLTFLSSTFVFIFIFKLLIGRARRSAEERQFQRQAERQKEQERKLADAKATGAFDRWDR